MNAKKSSQEFNTHPIYVSRFNIDIGTAFMETTVPVERQFDGDVLLFCVVYHISGSGQYIDNRTNKVYAFKPGTLRAWKPNMSFTRISYPGKHLNKHLTIPVEFYTLLGKMNLLPEDTPLLDLGGQTNIASRFDELIFEVKSLKELNLPLASNKAFSFLTELLLPRPAISEKWRSQMEEAASQLEADFTEKISIDELASSLNMSVTNFRRIFNSFYGVSPIVYRVQKKIELIKQILITEKLLIKEIAERFGYADTFTFSRQFKKYTGITPREYRSSQH